MKRRQYLWGIGTGVTSAVATSAGVSATDHVSIDIVETNAPVEQEDSFPIRVEIGGAGSEREVTVFGS